MIAMRVTFFANLPRPGDEVDVALDNVAYEQRGVLVEEIVKTNGVRAICFQQPAGDAA